MGMRATRNFSLKGMQFVPGRTHMQKVGDQLAARTVARTMAGRDENGHPFKPYAVDGPKAGQRVDLTETGEMLADYGPLVVTERYVGLGFATERSRKLADIHNKGKGHMPVRRFTGVPAAWVTEVRALLSQGVSRALKLTRR